METIKWINQVLKTLEDSRKKHLSTIKQIQGEIKHFNYIKKIVRNNGNPRQSEDNNGSETPAKE